MVLDEQPTGFKKGEFLKTSQLHKCGFAYITKSTARNQSIIQKSFSSLLHPKWCLMSNQQVLERVDF
jgi:hypothetical protein